MNIWQDAFSRSHLKISLSRPGWFYDRREYVPTRRLLSLPDACPAPVVLVVADLPTKQDFLQHEKWQLYQLMKAGRPHLQKVHQQLRRIQAGPTTMRFLRQPALLLPARQRGLRRYQSSP